MEPRDRISGMVSQTQQRQNYLDGRRVGERIAAFFTRRHVALAQFVDQLLHDRISARQHPDAVARCLCDQLLYPLSGVSELNIVGVFSVTSFPCGTEFDISREILAGRGVVREPFAPGGYRPLEPLEIPVARQIAEKTIHRVDHAAAKIDDSR